MLPLTATGARVVRPVSGGGLEHVTADSVCAKYSIPAAQLLTDYKAMVGEPGDNIPGVPGIGPKRASTLLRRIGGLERVIEAGAGGYSKDSELVAQHADAARRALRLVSLRVDVPIPPIDKPRCAIRRSAGA